MPFLALLAATTVSIAPIEGPRVPPGPDSRATSASSARTGLLLQTWVAGNETGLPHASVRLRRLQLKSAGDIVPGALQFAAMADLNQVLETVPLDGTPINSQGTIVRQSVNPVALLRDLNATVRTPLADILVGQAKIPISLDGLNSSSGLLLPERAAMATEFGNKRDLGVQATRTFGPVKATAGLFSRRTILELTGPPTAEPPRDGAVRVDITPLAGLQLGAVAYGTVVGRGMSGTRDRGELDLRWETGPAVLQAELIQGADIEKDGSRRRSQGTYVAAGYRLTDALQPVARVGYLNRDLDRATDDIRPATQLDLGLNYDMPSAGMRFQTSWSATWTGAAAPTQAALLTGQFKY